MADARAGPPGFGGTLLVDLPIARYCPLMSVAEFLRRGVCGVGGRAHRQPPDSSGPLSRNTGRPPRASVPGKPSGPPATTQQRPTRDNAGALYTPPQNGSAAPPGCPPCGPAVRPRGRQAAAAVATWVPLGNTPAAPCRKVRRDGKSGQYRLARSRTPRDVALCHSRMKPPSRCLARGPDDVCRGRAGPWCREVLGDVPPNRELGGDLLDRLAVAAARAGSQVPALASAISRRPGRRRRRR
jgi:hypothetical protein